MEYTKYTIAECEICSQLNETETSFYKYGADDMDRPLPSSASRLEAAEDATGYDKERNHVKRCPLCGTFYQYEMRYDYYVNGSEDEEILTRLTPAQGRAFLSAEEYATRMAAIAHDLQHAQPRVRRYAAKCMASHYLDCGEPAEFARMLAEMDGEAAAGALAFLAKMAEDGCKLPEIARNQPLYQNLTGSTNAEIARLAKRIVQSIKNF